MIDRMIDRKILLDATRKVPLNTRSYKKKGILVANKQKNPTITIMIRIYFLQTDKMTG